MRNERLPLSERGESKGANPIDALIDDAARQLMAGEPSSSLRGAVRDRVGSRRSHWSLAPAFAGSVALVILAILIGTTSSGPGESPRPPDVARVDVGPALAGVAAEPERPERLERSERSERPERSERLERLERSEDLPEEEDPLIPPITIEPLTTVQIAVDMSSGVMPIEIAPLQIEPLLSE